MSNDSEDTKKLDPSSITYGDELGRGGFAIVFKALLKTKDGTTREVAAKRLHDQDVKEIEHLAKFNHPNIISYIGYSIDGDTLISTVTIITELAEKGDLRSYLGSSDGPLEECLSSRWIKEAGRAIQYLHQNNVVHRDIKSSNYLITADNILKLADFGLAKDLDETMATVSKGTVRWMAPEVFNDLKRSKKSDVFSYAMVVWEILYRLKPYHNLQDIEYVIKTAICDGKRPEITEECSDRLKWLMENGWHWDYQQRPTIDDMLTMLEADQAKTVPDILGEFEEEKQRAKKKLESNVYYPEMQSELKSQNQNVEDLAKDYSEQMKDLEELRLRMKAKGKEKKAKKAKPSST